MLRHVKKFCFRDWQLKMELKFVLIHKLQDFFVFNSHIFQIFHDRLQPLLTEIKKNRSILAMSQLDYIRANTMLYHFNIDYKPRYGFDWRLVFFEDYFRSDQMEGKLLTDTFP